MAKVNLKGAFITFEGPEGCGKSTQAKLLYERLKKLKYPVIFIREPGTTIVGEKIRSILLDKNNKLTDKTEMLLYMAARSQIVDEVIAPALKAGQIIICDRFLDATICYQGYAGGINLSLIMQIGEFVTNKITPDLTILLDIPVEVGLRKCRVKIFDRMEAKPVIYHQKVRQGYLALAKQDPGRIKVVKVESKIKDTQEKVLKIVKQKLWLG
jgi:dTMP kinase